MRKYQINLTKNDINTDRYIYLIDDDRMRIAHLGKIAPKQYVLYSVSKLPEARGPKNIHFLYEVVAYMFLHTDAIIVDTHICKKNRKSIFAAKSNPGWQIMSHEGNLLHFRWKIGDCYEHVSPTRQKVFLKKFKETFDYET